jgi:segregation and condensation protein A
MDPLQEFKVKLERFEGPYPKLLELIEERKLSITEVSLVAIADTYIAYVQSLQEKNLVDISQFIVVASTLVLMKAKSLIPGAAYTNDEEKQVHALERKLEVFAILVAAVDRFKSVHNKTPLYSRDRITYKGGMAFVPDKRINKEFIHSVALLTIENFESPKSLVKVAVAQAIRIEHVIENMLARVRTMSSVSLTSLAEGATSVEERKKIIIVHFIALLELLRGGAITATQHEGKGEILIGKDLVKNPVDTPKSDQQTPPQTQAVPIQKSQQQTIAPSAPQTTTLPHTATPPQPQATH